MMFKTGFGRRGCFDLKPARCAIILLSAAAAGCSADITRFDSASFSLNDPPDATAAAQAPPQKSPTDFNNPVTRSQRPGPYGAGLAPASGIESEPLPDATPVTAAAPAPAPSYAEAQPARGKPLYRPGGQQIAMAGPPAAPAGAEAAKGELIEVQPGDTLYRLSRQHQVSLAELMSVNGLTSPDIKPGQKLHLPAGGSSRVAAMPQAAPAAPAAPLPASPQVAAAAAAPRADLAAKYNGSYTVQPGDSIYKIARAHKVPFTELQQVNGITDPTKVRPGVALKVPTPAVQTAAASPSAGASGMATNAITDAPASPAVPQAPVSAPAPVSPPGPSTSTQPTILNAQSPSETIAPVAPAPQAGSGKGDKIALAMPPPPAAAADNKLRWPTQGKIIAGFGGRPDGTHNDGINLAVPQGTDVHSAESGVIAYAGSELKGYGNLVLVRHDNGWVTAYAHNEELLVKRGDKVKRGQVIAKAGKTGSVDQPQVHFELRQGSKPVDPTPFMERL